MFKNTRLQVKQIWTKREKLIQAFLPGKFLIELPFLNSFGTEYCYHTKTVHADYQDSLPSLIF